MEYTKIKEIEIRIKKKKKHLSKLDLQRSYTFLDIFIIVSISPRFLVNKDRITRYPLHASSYPSSKKRALLFSYSTLIPAKEQSLGIVGTCIEARDTEKVQETS